MTQPNLRARKIYGTHLCVLLRFWSNSSLTRKWKVFLQRLFLPNFSWLYIKADKRSRSSHVWFWADQGDKPRQIRSILCSLRSLFRKKKPCKEPGILEKWGSNVNCLPWSRPCITFLWTSKSYKVLGLFKPWAMGSASTWKRKDWPNLSSTGNEPYRLATSSWHSDLCATYHRQPRSQCFNRQKGPTCSVLGQQKV